MKVLLLGGTGLFGRNTANYLAREELITEIGVASRSPESGQRAADEIGEKAHTVCVDIQDLSRLTSIASDYHILVNAAGPTSEVQVPSVEAAIKAGVHYCDISVSGKYAQRALKLDPQAKANDVSAIICTGWLAILNLMAVYAAKQLDQTERVSVTMLFDYTPESFFSPVQSLPRAREKGRVETSWDIIETAGEPILTFSKGEWVRLDPLENPVDLLHPSGKKVTAYLTDSPCVLTLPDHLPGVQTVTGLLGMIPPQLMELFIIKGQRVARGELDWEKAALEFFETAVADEQRWLSVPADYQLGWWMWAAASGLKDGREAHCLCWPSMLVDWTAVTLVITALRILRGEVSFRGVFQSEACFELQSFMDEAKNYMSQEDSGKPLFNERIFWQE